MIRNKETDCQHFSQSRQSVSPDILFSFFRQISVNSFKKGKLLDVFASIDSRYHTSIAVPKDTTAHTFVGILAEKFIFSAYSINYHLHFQYILLNAADYSAGIRILFMYVLLFQFPVLIFLPFLIHASLHPLLITFRNLAGHFPPSVKSQKYSIYNSIYN